MSFRFGIIGAGWYGCHIAASFKALDLDVTVFDREGQILSRAHSASSSRGHGSQHARVNETVTTARQFFRGTKYREDATLCRYVPDSFVEDVPDAKLEVSLQGPERSNFFINVDGIESEIDALMEELGIIV